MKKPRDVTILGAGLAGLSCAWELARAGVKVTVLEAENYVGGMSASFTHKTDKGEDFTYDFGPHRFHTQEQELEDHVRGLLGENHRQAHRLSRIFLFNKFFNYPLKTKNVLLSLPPHLLIKAFLDYFWVKSLIRLGIKRIPDDNFENWVTKRFGATLYKIFFGTYTEKAWGMSPREISADWASQRITLLSLWDTVKKTLFQGKGDNTPRTLVTEFLYPDKGGIGAICRGYAEAIEKFGGQVITNAPATKIEHKPDGSIKVEYGTEQGGVIEGQRIISTIPITQLVHLLAPQPPAEVLTATSNLKYVGIVFVYLILNRTDVSPDSWVYLPEHKLTVHRISEFRNFSPHNVPAGKTMLCAEITCRKGDDIWNMDLATATRVAANDLAMTGLIKAEEVESSFIHKLDYAYPVYDLQYKENLAPLRSHLATIPNLETGGRQGLFRYNNMDQSVEMGRKMAQTLLEGNDAGHEQVATDEGYFG